MINLITPSEWHDYELIDSGYQEKLERFGKFILARPEPQAVWSKSMSEEQWNKLCNAKFIRKKGGKADNFEKGEWTIKSMPEQWGIQYKHNDLNIKFRLGLTSFGHIGVFPEQADNWNYIFQTIQNSKFKIQNSPKVLNLFAYTGGSSLAAKAAGADVVHVDSVRPVINWANENSVASNLTGIRWVVEDAMKFVKREVKRGSKYNGIILDPPAYGRGPDSEKWLLEESINELISLCSQLADNANFFLVLSLYSMGYSSLIADNLVKTHFIKTGTKEFGELYFPDKAGKQLPFGVFTRFRI
jgi:23S rRNA (cytosine1962-C5)-methyltransferase